MGGCLTNIVSLQAALKRSVALQGVPADRRLIHCGSTWQDAPHS